MSFLNLYTFDGRMTRDRNQEAMINSLNERDRFLQKLEQDRAARAEDVRKKTAALRIQKFYRAYLNRKKLADKIRQEFDSLANSTVPQILATQAMRLNVFYRFLAPGDNARLIDLCGTLSRAAEEHGTTFLNSNTRMNICRKIFLYINLEEVKNFSMLPVGPLRFMDWFCTDEDYDKLIHYGWYEGTIRLIQASISPDALNYVQDSLPPRVDALCNFLVTPALEKTIRENRIKHLLEVLFIHQDVNLMYAVIVPYLARQLKEESLKCALTVTAKIERRRKEADLLCCHLYVLLLRPEKNLPMDDCLHIFHGFAACFPAWIVNDKTVLESGKIEQYLHRFIYSPHFANIFTEAVKRASTEEDMKAITKFSSVAPFSLIDVMSSTSLFLERLYSFVTNMKSIQVSFSKTTVETYVRKLQQGISLTEYQRAEFLPSLTLLSSLVCSFVDSTFDEDFAPDGRAANSLAVITNSTRLIRDLTLGLIDLAFPDDVWKYHVSHEQRKEEEAAWNAIYEQLIKTLQTVHRKNTRVPFLPDGFWTNHGREIMISKNHYMPKSRRGPRPAATTPFSFIRYLAEDERDTEDDGSDEEMDEKDKPSTSDLRNLSIIRSIPFLLVFDKRLKIFQELLTHERRQYGNDDFEFEFRRGPSISITVRRQYLYDDSFIALSPGEAPNLRLPVRVRMVNWAGANEHGVDGGGIFREFLSELLKSGLDPERGLFCYTHDRLLYPNPIASSVYADSYSQHYYFLGRMLAKLIYEGMMLDVRFADFFLVQLLGYRITNIDLEQMKSYDPNVYKHLRDLLNYSDKQLAELGLDFSVVTDTLGKVELIELKNGGREIPVTKSNIREYIQLYVNYHLKERISTMVDAMRHGVSDVIEPTWLGMFAPAELQVIVSGADAEISADDMRKNTIVYTCEGVDQQEYMYWFWDIVQEMIGADKASLLKFITGCPRPPINGFKSLSPNIAIQLNTHREMLPMSATCMNMLKLPVYESKEVLKQKICYAINAGAGFELA